MKKYAFEIICALMFLLFLYSGLTKVIAFSEFSGEMHNQPFPYWFAEFVKWFIPPTELIIAAMLLFERLRLKAFYFFVGLMSLFTIYTGTVLLHFFRVIPCSCGGVIKQLNWKQHLVFNLFFVIISIVGIYIIKRNRKPKNIVA
jgi:uncharacterized membrane protein YphA (DoxX/SURF4 family)